MTAVAAARVRMPAAGGEVSTYTLAPRSPAHDFTGGPPTSRTVYAAAHVVADAMSEGPGIDWDATMAFRRYLWSLGLGVADAMDTAQRGGGLDWRQAKELIERTGAESQPERGSVVFGAMTDQLPADRCPTLGDIIDAYVEQCGWIRRAGGTPVLMASRHLAKIGQNPEDYWTVYDAVLRQVGGPVMLHWLGAAFDPLMVDYWGTRDLDIATDVVLTIMREHADTIDGIKISLLDQAREVDLRRRLPDGVRMFTGDDFHYDELILGDEQGHSHALLGAFDAIAAPARAALARLDAGDIDGYTEILWPTIPLARHLFQAPTSAYKTGVVFLAYLNGHQDHFHMIGGAESFRSVPHLVRLFQLADQAGAVADPGLAAHRMSQYLAVAGVEA